MLLLIAVLNVLVVISSGKLHPSDIVKNCGKYYQKPDKTYILEGTPVSVARYPFMAGLFKPFYTCGGALISDQWVITAAHCADDGMHITVALGMQDLPRMHGLFSDILPHFPYEEFDLKTVIFKEVKLEVLSPYYNPDTHDDDIALLKFDEKVRFTDYIQPICLPPDEYVFEARFLYLAGWGYVRKGKTVSATRLQELFKHFWPCDPEKPPNENPDICENSNETAPCKGDDGSPVFDWTQKDDGSFFYTLMAIFSGPERCNLVKETHPGDSSKYTSVSFNMPWIEEVAFWTEYNPFPDKCGHPVDKFKEIQEFQVGLDGYGAINFVVTVTMHFSPVCGGALLNDFWVVTSGKCLLIQLQYRDRPVVVFRSEKKEGIQYKTSIDAEMFFHPLFDKGHRPNDLCLLKLKERKNFNKWVQPICLPRADQLNLVIENVYWAEWEYEREFHYSRGRVVKCTENAPQDVFCTIFWSAPSIGYPIFTVISKGQNKTFLLLGLISKTFLFKVNATKTELRVQSTNIAYYLEWIDNTLKGKLTAKCGMVTEDFVERSLSNTTTIVPNNAYPYLVILQTAQGETAQGAVLSSFWIITVAHFFERAFLSEITAFVGVQNITDWKIPQMKRKLISLKIHPSYNLSKTTMDMALVKMNQEVEINDKFQPICLPLLTLREMPSILRMTGWDFSTDNFTSSPSQYIITNSEEGLCNTTEMTYGGPCFASVESLNRNDSASINILGASGSVLFDHTQLSTKPLKYGWTLFGFVSRAKRRSGGFHQPVITTEIAKVRSWIEEIIFDFPENKMTHVCGLSFFHHSVKSGSTANPGSFPYVVFIRHNLVPKFSGTIVGKQWILTAAHCLENFSKAEVKVIEVVAGMTSLDRLIDRLGVYLRISDFELHPKYDRISRAHDVALLKLKEPLAYTDVIQPACLPEKAEKIMFAEQLYVAGWGLRKGNVTKPSSEMLQFRVAVLGCSDCVETLNAEIKSCEGDEGGGVYKNHLHSWFPAIISKIVVGVISELPGGECNVKHEQMNMSFIRTYASYPWMKSVMENYAFTERCGMDFTIPNAIYNAGGEMATEGEFPFGVIIRTLGGTWCAAAFFKSEWIITSASCVINFTAADIEMAIGSNKLDSEDLFMSRISEIYVHPNYSEKTDLNNIALLEVPLPVDYTDKIQPICLPIGYSLPADVPAFLVSWTPDEGGKKPHYLRYTLLTAKKEKKKCGYQLEEKLCLVDDIYGMNSCNYEVGSPIAVQQIHQGTKGNITTWTLIGIVTGLNLSCHDDHKPVQALNMTLYLEWINKIIHAHEVNPFPDKCGYSLFHGIQQHGMTKYEAMRGKYPFMAAIASRTSEMPGCAGTILNTRWILSSTTCIYTLLEMDHPITCILGAFNPDGPYSLRKYFESKILLYYFLSQVGTIPKGDFALLQLLKPISFNGWIQPICLPIDDAVIPSTPGVHLQVPAWHMNNATRFYTTIVEMSLDILPLEKCKRYSENGTVLCLGNETSHFEYTANYGDPVVFALPSGTSNVKWTLAGVVTNIEMDDPDFLTILPFHKVSTFLKWIHSTMDSSGTGDSEYCGQTVSFERDSPENKTEEVYYNSFPFIAFLVSGDTVREAVIINKLWIISSGSFFVSALRNNTIVRYGVRNFKELDEGSSWNYIYTVFFYPRRNPEKNLHNIGLSRLLSEITFNDYIQVACLPVKKVYLGDIYSFFVLGYGTSHSTANTSVEEKLWQIHLDKKGCNNLTTEYHGFTFECLTKAGKEENICEVEGRIIFAKYLLRVQPLIFGWTILGITRSKSNCTSPLQFEAYKVSSYIEWTLRIFHEEGVHAGYCGRSFYAPRISSKKRVIPAAPGSFPFIVSVRFNDRHICAGTLINDDWVVSARSCIYRTFKTITVALGVYDHKNVKRFLTTDVLHFIYYEPGKEERDIVLMKIAHVPKWKTVDPICLPFHIHQTHPIVFVAGWGNFNGKKTSLMIQMTLNMKEIYHVKNEEAIRLKAAFDPRECLIDKGTPIFAQATHFAFTDYRLWTLLGVITSENALCNDGSAVVANITNENYLDWFRELLLKDAHLPEYCGKFSVVNGSLDNKPNLGKKISRGTRTSPGEFPWMVYISRPHEYKIACSGTLISKRTVITAGWCFLHIEVEYVTLILGSDDISNRNDRNRRNYTVKSIKLHPYFIRPYSLYNVAILITKEEIIFSKWIQPVCLPPRNYIPGMKQEVFVVGFNDYKLRYARLLEMQLEECYHRMTAILEREAHLHLNSICLNAPKARVEDTDRGGAMLIHVRISETDQYWLIYGTITRETGAVFDYPIVRGIRFNDIRDWIESVMVY